MNTSKCCFFGGETPWILLLLSTNSNPRYPLPGTLACCYCLTMNCLFFLFSILRRFGYHAYVASESSVRKHVVGGTTPICYPRGWDTMNFELTPRPAHWPLNSLSLWYFLRCFCTQPGRLCISADLGFTDRDPEHQ